MRYRLTDKLPEAVDLIDRGLGYEDITERLNLYRNYRRELLQMMIARQTLGKIKGKHNEHHILPQT